MKDPPNGVSEDMHSLPKTNSYGGFGSPTASTVSAMAFNTVGDENKVINVGTSMADDNKAAVAKKDSLTINHSARRVLVQLKKDSPLGWGKETLQIQLVGIAKKLT